jgi:hypothetical protein
MTSSDCLSTNNLHPHLSTKSRLTLPVSSIHNEPDELTKTSSTPTSLSQNSFHTSISHNQLRSSQPNMFAFPRPPAPALLRRNIQFKPPEQDVLDKNFFRTFNMEQQEKNLNDSTTNIGIILKKNSMIDFNSFYYKKKVLY